MSYRIAVDIGGTFTDYVALDEETSALKIYKSPSTPKNFADGVMNCIEGASIPLNEVSFLVHGSTIVINALTERKGARTALITTQGFRDALEIGRANRTDLYNLRFQKPTPFVPRKYRFEVTERLDKDGNVLIPLDENDVKEIATRCKKEGIEAIAVCLLHSYANAVHEEKVGKLLRELLPEAEISLSSEVIKEWREYERSNTTVFNAYVKPVARKYLDTLKEIMKQNGLRHEPYAMLSNGGSATFEMTKMTPINVIESGPVGGVIGGNELGKILDEKNIITFDIGGTTAKTSLVYNNEVRLTNDYYLERTPIYPGYPVRSAIVDIIEIGAGGGSIAWIDPVGNLKVGPQSAGADPGPACYNIGGTDPTLTDANYISGRIDLKRFLGDKYNIDIHKSRDAVAKIASHYNISVEEAARGIIRIANNNMMNALRLVSVRRGYDPHDFVLVAMGGNGGVHGPFLGKELHVKKIIIPRNPGVFGAWGMLMTDMRQDYIQTRVTPIVEDHLDAINSIYFELIENANDVYKSYGLYDVYVTKAADIRYVGQEHTVKTPIPGHTLDSKDIPLIRKSFESLHEQHYSFKLETTPIEIVNYHVIAYCKVQKSEIKPTKIQGSTKDAFRTSRQVDFDEYGLIKDVPVYVREKLGNNNSIQGPAIIEEKTSVTVVYPDQKATVDDYGNLIVEED